LEILDAKPCIFVHPESLNVLQLWKNFNMTGEIYRWGNSMPHGTKFMRHAP